MAERIRQRTGGNPFFTEEVVQSLVESGQLVGTKGRYRLTTPIEKLDVPATVQAVLAARIDRLPEREKQVLQAASVIGREFSLPVLAASRRSSPRPSSPPRSRQLRNAELVFEQSLYPVEEYVFKHALTQEVALRVAARERRARAHAAAARAIEALSATSSTRTRRCSRITGRRRATRCKRRAGTAARGGVERRAPTITGRPCVGSR